MDNKDNTLSDYTQVGLNKYLMPLRSPIGVPGSFVTGMDFNTGNDRNNVTAINLRNFSFNSGTGGTIVLGGVNNGNGNFIIKDNSGNTIVTGNNQGLTVTNGSITIKNPSGQLLFDGSGVVSSANFSIDSVESTTLNSTTGTAYVDVPGASLNSFVTTRSIKALLSVSAWGYNIQWLAGNGAVMQLQCLDTVNGTLLNFPMYTNAALTRVSGTGPPFTAFSYNVDYQWSSTTVVVNLTPGTHTLKLQYATTVAGTATLAFYQLGYALFGN